jgi:hypothetical protein
MSFTPDSNVATQWQDLTIYQSKDADLTLTLTDPTTGLPYNLTGLTVNLVVKPNRDTPDSGGTTYVCTVSSPTSGIATVTLPAASHPTAGVSWYRVDLVGTETKAVKFGRLTVYAV